jgi:poly(A) polymerase
VGEGKPVAPSFLLACVLWSDVRQAWDQRRGKVPPFPALQEAIDEVFDARIGDVSGRGKLGADMREIWMMQPRFEKRTGSGPMTLVMQARFRAGFDFMRLRADIGEVEEDLADWWQTFSLADDLAREDMLQQVRLQTQRPQRVPRTVRVPSANNVASDASPPEEGALAEGDAPRKRRRRRRKPGAGADGAGGTVEG